MNLKLQLLVNSNETTWTLKSTRGNYSIGTTPGCDIELTGISVDVNLKLIYDEYSKIWYVSDLSNRGNLSIDNQQLRDYTIKSQSTIMVDRGVTLTIIPEGIQAPTHQPRTVSQTSSSKGLRKLTWAQYVDECVRLEEANRFSLITGYRFTPWVRATGTVGFNSFDGYIIPDFQQIPGCEKSSELVVAEIQNKLGEMIETPANKKYINTDCYIASLTDAHLIDSLTQSFFWSFFWVEFFPIRRGGKNPKIDYRDFFVVSYNRVKTYLLIENYGADLFVSWITRFEPRPTGTVQVISSMIAILLTMAAFYSHNILLLVSPLLLWASVYLAMPAFMLIFDILPKKANANFIGICMFLFTLLVISIFLYRGNNYQGSPYELMALLSMLIGGWIIFIPVFVVMFIIFAFNPKNIPALDLVDAKKLDDTISKQVESVLKPMLEKANYTTEQIGQILTRTSLGRIQFRR
jgi:hypothetical protein